MSSFVFFIFVVVAIFVVVKMSKNSPSAQAKSARHCMTCGGEGQPRSAVKGSILIEIVLWLCFIVPGLIYSLWRMNSRAGVCAACGSTTLVPVDSPSAQAHRKSLQT